MTKTPPDPDRPRTLAAAIERIKQLTASSAAHTFQRPQGASPPGGNQPILKPAPQATPGNPAQTFASPPPTRKSLSEFALGFASTSPLARKEFYSACSDAELRQLMSNENSKPRKERTPRLCDEVHEELSRRGLTYFKRRQQ